jgi:RHS repeat-associated protein
LARHWNVTQEPNEPPVFTAGDSTWTDYLGPQPYVDYTIDEGDPSEVMRYLAGFGVHAQEDVAQSPSAVRFLHGDLTRSTMMTTDTSATVVSRVAYTAFGDPVTADGQGGWRVGWPMGAGGIGVPPVTRYQYDGGWGYESGLISLFGEDETLPPVTLQHVGWRWYQPGIGRFVQRDPIGLGGGLNVYAYVESNPLLAVDPMGLFNDNSLARTGPWSPTDPAEAFLFLTGGRESWIDDPKTVARVQWCLDIGGTLVLWFSPTTWVSKAGRAITVVRWAVKGSDVWY